jgi:hypothetical protein
MSQWGKSKEIDGVTLLPNVCEEDGAIFGTSVFEPARGSSLIDAIAVFNTRGLPDEKAQEVWQQACDRYLHQPYSLWIEEEMPMKREVQKTKTVTETTRFTLSTDEIEDKLRPLLLQDEKPGTVVEFWWDDGMWPSLDVTLTHVEES